MSPRPEDNRAASSAPTTLVVGVGYLGQRFVDQAGGDVQGLKRAEYDLDTGGPLPVELPPDYKILYTVPPSRESAADVRLENLLAELSPPPARFVYISTTGVYGDHRGGQVDEATATNPSSAHAARRVAAEQALEDWSRTAKSEIIILRVPGIYGPGRLGVDRIRDRVPVIRQEDAGPGNRIHVDDLVSCCVAALDDETPGGIYNVGDGDHRTSTEFSSEVARQSGLQPPPTVTMAEAEEQFSPMRLSFLRDQRQVDTAKMREVLGVTPRYTDVSEGIAASLDT